MSDVTMTLDETINRLKDTDRQIAELSRLRTYLRTTLQHYVEQGGGQLTTAGMKATILPGSPSIKYDTRAIDEVVMQLIATGDIDMLTFARQISAARQSTARQSYLRITWEEQM
jgi:hypothetical protein